MNNLQCIVRNDTRTAMHVAVEICEVGDFDSVTEAVRWLMQERDDSATPSGGECEITNCDSGEMDIDVYALSCGHVAYYPSVYEEPPAFCPECGKAVRNE